MATVPTYARRAVGSHRGCSLIFGNPRCRCHASAAASDEKWLVVGGTGMAGFGVVRRLHRDGQSVTLLTRSPSLAGLPLLSEVAPGVNLVQGRLDGSEAFSLSEHGITHLFYSAFAGGRLAKDGRPVRIPELNQQLDSAEKLLPRLLGWLPASLRQKAIEKLISVAAEKQDIHLEEENGAMLTAAIQACGASLQHVVLCCGGKVYGHHLGPMLWPEYTSPFREYMRAPGPNFYFGQLRALEAAVKEQSLTATVLCPSMIIGPVAQLRPSTMNIALCLGVYATLCRELQLPLKFPGVPAVYRARWSMSPSSRIAELAVEASRRRDLYAFSPELHLIAACGGSGSWQEVWPKLGEHFGVEVAGPDDEGRGLDLQAWCAGRDVDSAWGAAVKRGGCQESALDSVLNLDFLSAIMVVSFDAEYSQRRCEELGLADDQAAWQALRAALLDLQAQRILPAPE